MKLRNITKILDKHLQELQFTDPGVRTGDLGHVKLRNRTKILDKHLLEIIQFTDPGGLRKGHFMHVKPSRFHPRGYAMPGANQKSICIWVPKELKYPFTLGYHLRYCTLDDPILDEDEILIFLLAHELRHRWQSQHPRYREVFGSRVTGEIDADAYAMHKVRAWRRRTRLLPERLDKVVILVNYHRSNCFRFMCRRLTAE
jgi:hypothetical protein